MLIPACVDVCRQYTSSLTGGAVQLVAAGGIFDGRGVAAALVMGAGAVWVGTRFVTARESAASKLSKKASVDSSAMGIHTLLTKFLLQNHRRRI